MIPLRRAKRQGGVIRRRSAFQRCGRKMRNVFRKGRKERAATGRKEAARQVRPAAREAAGK